MLVPNRHFHRLAAFTMAIFGFYAFVRGVNTNEFKILDDGSMVESKDGNLAGFKSGRTVLTFKAGFDVYRSIGYGLSSLLLFLDLLLDSGHLTLPALVLAAGEIVADFSDLCLAVVMISAYVGGYPAAAYGITYSILLSVEVLVWLGTCKFHESCRMTGYENKMRRKRRQSDDERAKKVG